MSRILLFLLALVLAGPAQAQTLPKFTGFVVDAANVLPPEQEATLTRRLDELQRATGNQLVVATIPDLQGYAIEEYGIALLRGWQVGLKDVGNGAILIVAPTDRKVRIEVGYGLEPVLTDAFSSIVINTAILPRFKAGDLPGGIVAGAEQIASQLALPDDDARAKVIEAAKRFDRSRAAPGGRSGGGGGLTVPSELIVFAIFAVVFVILALSRRGGGGGRRYRGGGSGGSAMPVNLWTIANEAARQSSRGGGWSSGGGFGGGSGGGGWMGGGFTGGGGGSGGGGGASGSW